MADTNLTATLADADPVVIWDGATACTGFDVLNDATSAGGVAVHVEGYHGTDVWQIIPTGGRWSFNAWVIGAVTVKRATAGSAATIYFGPTNTMHPSSWRG